MDRIPAKARDAVLDFVYGPLAANPHRTAKPLLAPFEGQHAGRRANFRIVYHIDDQEQTVTIANVGHRSTIYRPR